MKRRHLLLVAGFVGLAITLWGIVGIDSAKNLQDTHPLHWIAIVLGLGTSIPAILRSNVLLRRERAERARALKSNDPDLREILLTVQTDTQESREGLMVLISTMVDNQARLIKIIELLADKRAAWPVRLVLGMNATTKVKKSLVAAIVKLINNPAREREIMQMEEVQLLFQDKPPANTVS